MLTNHSLQFDYTRTRKNLQIIDANYVRFLRNENIIGRNKQRISANQSTILHNQDVILAFHRRYRAIDEMGVEANNH